MDAPFICLMGLDGTGKTTQARRLVRKLNAEGIPARYVWCRWRPCLMKPIQIVGRICLRQRNVTPENYVAFTASKQRMLGRNLIGRLWLRASLLDYLIVQVAPKIALPRLRKKTLVCDRYLYDTLIDQSINLGLSPAESSRLLSASFSRLFPRPTRTILIDLDPETAFQRKNDVKDIAYLTDRRQRYLAFAHHLGAAIVDGSGNPEDVEKRIAAALRIPPAGQESSQPCGR